MGNSVGALPGSRPLVLCLSDQVGLVGVLAALPGAFISAQMVFFAVMLGTGAMGVRGQVATLSCNLL